VEARLAECWAVEVSKEFVWLTRSPATASDRLELRAFADGDVICEAVFQLGM
jgi:hypothetical protein